MVEISCPNCHESYRVNDDVVGSTVECSVCHSTFTATASSISLKPIKPSTAVPLQSHCTKEKKWIVLLTAVCAMTVIQFSMLIVLVTHGGTSGGPSLIAGQPVASLPSGTPSELLLKYTEQGELSYVEAILKQNPSLDINRPRAGENKTALYIACEKGYLDIVRLLLKQQADMTICCDIDNNPLNDSKGYSPLTIAARNGHLEIVKALLSYGVSIESRDAYNRTAIYAAVANNKPIVVKFLCESGAKVNIYRGNTWTPLTGASYKGYVEVVKVLLKSGNDIDLEMKDNAAGHCNTPLYHAALEGHPDAVDILCKAGADVNAVSLTYVRNPEVVKILKKYGAK